MHKEAITANIIIDTVYGTIHKVGTCRIKAFNNKQILEHYLNRLFNNFKIAILQEFENKKNSNKIEV